MDRTLGISALGLGTAWIAQVGRIDIVAPPIRPTGRPGKAGG